MNSVSQIRVKFVWILILVVFIEESLTTTPGSGPGSGHGPKSLFTRMGFYSWMGEAENTCGYLSPINRSGNTTQNGPKPRIINGDLASLGEFPWHVIIFHKYKKEGNLLCNGVLIHKFWVLTVRNCMLPKRHGDAPIVPSMLNVSLGTVDSRVFFSIVDVSEIILHPDQDERFNLALLRLATAVLPEQSGITTNAFYRINYICLPAVDAFNEYTAEKGIISGFGNTDVVLQNTHLQRNYMLRKAVVTIDSVHECYTRLPNYYSKFTICVPQEEHMICHGDSGSGLVQFDGVNDRAILIGIIMNLYSWDQRAGPCTPGVIEIMRVSFAITGFIERVIALNETLPQYYPPYNPPQNLPPIAPNRPKTGPIPKPIPVGPKSTPGRPYTEKGRKDENDKIDPNGSDSGNEDNFSADKIIALNIITIIINILFL